MDYPPSTPTKEQSCHRKNGSPACASDSAASSPPLKEYVEPVAIKYLTSAVYHATTCAQAASTRGHYLTRDTLARPFAQADATTE
eukprot:16430725-Heterocapsa_arctica.AAC.1